MSKIQSIIVEEMLIDFANELGVSTISDASDIAIKAKVYSAQIEGIYYNQEFLKKQMNPRTATGSYLDIWAESLGIKPRKEATKAIGTVILGRKNPSEKDILIPKGTMVSTDPDTYGDLIKGITTQNIILPSGSLEIAVSAKAEEPGEKGNVPTGAFTILNNPPIGIEYVRNDLEFSDGTNEENDENFRSRFQKEKFYGTQDAFANRAREVPGVTYAKTLENNRGPGTTDVLISTVSGIPSDTLVDDVLQHLLEKRPLGCDLGVIKPIAYVFNLTVQVVLKEGFTLSSTIEGITIDNKIKEAIRNYLKTVGIGGIIRKTGIETSIFILDEVIDVEVISPDSNITLGENEVVEEGDFIVEQL